MVKNGTESALNNYLDLNRGLAPEEVAVREQTHRFSQEVTRPASVELDKLADPADVIREGSIFWDVFRKGYEQGQHVSGFSEAEGGVSLSTAGRHAVAEEMGWGSSDFAIGFGVAPFPFTFANTFAALTGNQTLKGEIVEPFLKDREAKYVGCWAITEPHHGSDVWALKTKAKRDGDDWIINGQKSAWVSNGTIASHALLFLAIDRSRGQAGGGVAVVPLNLPGVTKGPPLNKLGQRALNQGEIFFDDVRIPKHYMLVEPEAYAFTIENVLTGANAGMGALFTGVARAAFEEALAYSKHRIQGGRPICEHQAVQLKLFDMFVKVQAARAISRGAMAYNTSGPPAIQYSIASKVFCTQAAFEVSNDAIQLHGGYGLSKDMLVEKLFRDARASMIEDGVNEVLSLSGARRLVG